ncbi:MAG: signal peptidase [Marmoricola sp.]|nr:signal peptidase [Marmoricola sp.]
MRRVPDRLLTLGAALGGLVLLLTSLGFLVGLRPVFLRSGSMAPTLTTGALVLVHEVPAADLVVGDVVCVRTATGSRVTHRVVGIRSQGGQTFLHLKGDANRVADQQEYPVSTAYRVVGDLPWVGYLVGAALSPGGLFGLGCFVMGLLSLVLRGGRGSVGPPEDPPVPRGPRTRGRRMADRTAALTAGALLAVLGPGQTTGAWAAAWTDPAAANGAALTAGTIAAPATFTCGGLGVLSVQFSWSAVAGATNYTVHYGAGGASTTTITGTSATLTAAISGGTAWVEANRSFGSTTWTSAASTTRTYTVAVVSLCS